jgi:hypothetical protein
MESCPSELAAANAAAGVGSSDPGRGAGYRGSSKSRIRDMFLQSSSGESNMLFNGLRVRMGVVTGEVDKPAEAKDGNALANIMNSMLYKLALGECVTIMLINVCIT